MIKELNLIFLVDPMSMIGIVLFERKNEEFLFNKFIFNNDIVDNIINAFYEVSRPKIVYINFSKKKTIK